MVYALKMRRRLLTEAASLDGQLNGRSTENTLPDHINRTG
jgi:hypothetical protein